MKHLKSFVALLLILSILAGVAVTAQASSKYYYTTGKTVLRIMPGFKENGIGLLPKNAKVKYLGNTCIDSQKIAWYKVSYKGYTGWIPVASAAKKKNGTTHIGNIEMQTSEPLRYKPSANSARLGTVKKGKMVKYYDTTIASNGRVWFLVRYHGKCGWVSGKHTELA